MPREPAARAAGAEHQPLTAALPGVVQEGRGSPGDGPSVANPDDQRMAAWEMVDHSAGPPASQLGQMAEW
jgi:hypothetical protein